MVLVVCALGFVLWKFLLPFIILRYSPALHFPHGEWDPSLWGWNVYNVLCDFIFFFVGLFVMCDWSEFEDKFHFGVGVLTYVTVGSMILCHFFNIVSLGLLAGV